MVSVIVPVYKVEAYLDACVESILGQSEADLELLLVDDGSPDDCPAICDAWAEKDSRIRVIHKENGGLSDARNAGLQAAAGDYIAFVDSDDTLEPEFLAVLLETMATTGAQIAGCAVELVDEAGKPLRVQHAREGVFSRTEALARLITENGITQTVWNKLYQRALCIPFEKGKHHEDDFWSWQVFDRAERIAMVDTPAYHYRQRTGSIMGAGYTPKRLDGLEARFLRMSALQKYEELACLTRQQFAFDCLWHLQCVLRCLEGEAQSQAKREVLAMLERTPRVSQRKLRLNLKYRVWYELVQAMPVQTAKIRNKLKIGL